jgi:hypothetical protein
MSERGGKMFKKSFGMLGSIIIIIIFSTQPVFAESGVFSFGAFGGSVSSFASHALEGEDSQYTDTKFKGKQVYGGSIMYRFPSGFAFELCAEKFSMDLNELGVDFGKLNMMPIMLLLKIQGMPKNEIGFTGHLDIGGGVSFNSFDNGSFLKELEETFGYNIKIETKDSFVFEIGGGIDYFFNKNVSLNIDGRLLISSIETSGWLIDANKLYANNLQVLLGLRFWF